MNVRELICELLDEIGESKLARHVEAKLRNNEDASVIFKVATSEGAGIISYLHLEYTALIAELE